MTLRWLFCVIGIVFVLVVPAHGGQLSSVSVSPSDDDAGASTIYELSFTTDDSLPTDGKVIITFESGAGFGITGVSVASSANSNLTGGFSTINGSGNVVTLERDGTGNAIVGAVAVTINIANVTNPTDVGSYEVSIETRENDDTVIDTTPSPLPEVSIAAAPLSKIVIEDAAGGSGTEITTISTTTDDDSQEFFAVGRDEFGNFVGDVDVTWGVTGGIGTVSPASGSNSTTLTLTTTGTGRVTADDGSGHGDATDDITVNAGALSFLIIRDASGGLGSPVDDRTLTTSDELTVHAAGYDADGNYRQDEDANWSSSGLSPAVTGSGTSKTFDPDATGSGTITAEVGAISDDTGTITVTTGTVNSIIVRDAPNNGGSAVGARSLTTDDVLTLYAAGYDSDDDYIGDVTVDWSVTGDLDAVSPTTGSSTVFDPSTPGTSGTIEATHDSGPADATGTIDVSVGALAEIVIRDASGGGGSEVEARTITTDNSLTLHAAGYDADGNFIADQSADWSSSGLTPEVSDNGVTSVTFEPSETGSGFVTATASGFSDVTGTITVNPGALSSIIIRDGAEGSGSEVASRTLTTDESLTLYAAGYDSEDNFISDISVTWDVTGSLDAVSAGPSTSVTFSPSNAPTSGTITADDGSRTDATETISVNPGALDDLIVRDAADGGGSAVSNPSLTTDETLTLFAAGYDAEDNYIADIISDWAITGGIGVVSPSTGANTIFDAQTEGSGGITATASSNSSISDGVGTVTVTAGDVASFGIASISNQTAGDAFDITIEALDANGNRATGFSGSVTISDMTGTITPTSSNNFTNGLLTQSVTITKSRVDNQITVTDNGKTGVANTFDVNPASLDHFTFDTISSPKTAGSSFQVTMTAKDAFDNTVTSYGGTVNFSVNKGSISPTSSGSFSSGVRTETVTIEQANSDVVITATDGSIEGESNSFNVQHASLTKFAIDPIGTQEANTPFLIAVTAQDAFDNTVTSFTGKVSIEDETDTITPTESGNFSGGKWSGTVTITQVSTDNNITVTNTAGTQSGTSGDFDVISSNVDHFTISTISSPQEAGTAFGITITAEDASNNTVTTFEGTVNLADLTGTLSPTITTEFTDGVLTDFQVTITEAGADNKITVTALGKSGESNTFDVDPAALDHFVFEEIASPQVAGTPFGITVTAFDAFENVVTDFNSSVTLSDNTGTIDPTSLGFVDGVGTDDVTITQKSSNNRITATFDGVSDESNSFNVNPGALDHLLIRNEAGGLGSEVDDLAVTLDQQVPFYAAGYDEFDNYIRDVSATWSVSGDLDPPSPLIGTSTVLEPETPNTSGRIIADTTGVLPDSTGNIIVGSIAKIRVRDAAGGQGNEVDDRQITTDDSLTLYAAGYDAGDNFIGDVPVEWHSSGTLADTVDADNVSSVIFRPSLAPASGKIFAEHPTADNDSTGTISVDPGAPSGTVALEATPATLPADGESTSTITSSVILDADGNAVGAGRNFLVTLSDDNLGTIVTPDADPGAPGHQIATDANSQLEFEFEAGSTGGTVVISVFSGNASGTTSIGIGSMSILSVDTDPTTVSRGQRDIEVRMVVENLSASTITDIAGSLRFTNSSGQSRSGQYTVTRTDAITQIAASSQATLTFAVSVSGSAALETITLDGEVSGKIGASDVAAEGALTTDSWTVEDVARLRAVSVSSPLSVVTVGNQGINVSVVVNNNLGSDSTATAIMDSIKLRFLLGGSVDKSSDFPFQPDGANPTAIAGGAQEVFDFTVTIGATADTGNYEIDAQVFGRDANSDSAVQDLAADTRHAWKVEGAPTLQIVSITPVPKTTFLASQTEDWSVRMAVQNNGPDPLDINFDPAETYIKFIIGTDVTDEYEIIYPTELLSGGGLLESGATDTLVFVVDSTGSSTGTALITGRVQATDVSTGNTIFDNTDDGGTGAVNIINPEFRVFISKTDPATINASQGIGIVNTNQQFKISVRIKNDLEEAVENTVIRLTAGGASTIASTNPDTIPVISAGAFYTHEFLVTAAGSANEIGETFTAEVLEATGRESGARARIGEPLDDDATVRIQTPARLRVAFEKLDPFQAVSDTFNVSARVTNAGQAAVEGTGLLRLFIDADYALVGTNSIQPFAVGQLIEWSVASPDTPTVVDTFSVEIISRPNDKNTGQPAQVAVSADTGTTQTVDVDLFIQNFSIVQPAGARDDTLSTGQTFDLEAALKVSENIDLVEVALTLPPGEGYQRVGGAPLTTQVANPDIETTLTWKLQVPGSRHDAPLPLIVSATGFDNGKEVSSVSDTLGVVAVNRAFVQFESFQVSNPNNATELARGQQFNVSAVVRNTGDAGLTGAAQLLLQLGNSGFVTSDTLRKPFNPDESVNWTLQVPDDAALGGRTISVRMDSIPKDENTGNTAAHDGNQITRSLALEVVDIGRLSIDTLRVIFPPGATDATVSTDQQFTVEAEVSFERVQDLQAELTVPTASGFRVIGNRFSNIDTDGRRDGTATWIVQAPSLAASDGLVVTVSGVDAADPSVQRVAGPDTVSITVVQRARLVFDARISGPPAATDRQLTFGQVFTVTAQLTNAGQAALNGVDTVRIELPSGYTTVDPQVQSLTPGGSGVATWQITAPNQTTNIQDIIVELIQRSRDENSGGFPPRNTNVVAISVRTEPLGLMTTVLSDRKKTSAVRGDNRVSIMGFELNNTGDLDIDVESMNLYVKDSDGNALAPNTMLSTIRAVDYANPDQVYGQVTQMPSENPIQLLFEPNITVPGGQTVRVDFEVGILAETPMSSFQLSVDNPQNDIVAIDADGNRVAIKDSLNLNIQQALTSGVSVLIDPGLKEGFFNYPNPFGFGTRNKTTIHYTLEQDSEVTIQIYTLLGELVWSRSFKATDPQGRAGTHDTDVVWNGTNDKGQPVLNGVYIAVLTTNSGRAETKIAVTR